jgi:hypothetical protein
LQAVLPATKIEDLEFVRGGRLIFGILDIDPAYPVSLLFEKLDEMMTDETTGACDENLRVVHRRLLLCAKHAAKLVNDT